MSSCQCMGCPHGTNCQCSCLECNPGIDTFKPEYDFSKGVGVKGKYTKRLKENYFEYEGHVWQIWGESKREWIGDCKSLNLTAWGETLADLKRVIAEIQDEYFRDQNKAL